MKNYKFSIIIPHLNEGYYLDMMLDSFHNYIKYENYEIIIVDDGSNNINDLNFINKHFLKDRIKLFKVNNFGAIKSRNYGAEKASGEILIFMDSHMYCKNDILEEINKIYNTKYNNGIIQLVIGSIADKKVKGNIYKIKDNLLNSTWDNYLKDDSYIIETPNIAGGCTIVKKNIFEKIGGFNKNFKKWGAEDLEFSMRAWLYGYKCYLYKNLEISHYFKTKFTNTEIKSEDVLHNKIIFALTCFIDKTRLIKVLDELKKYYGDIYEEQYKVITESEQITNFIKNEQSKFKYDDNWYFNKFKNYYEEF